MFEAAVRQYPMFDAAMPTNPLSIKFLGRALGRGGWAVDPPVVFPQPTARLAHGVLVEGGFFLSVEGIKAASMPRWLGTISVFAC